MTFWEFLERRWPGERAWVVILLAILIGSMLKMADHNPELWEVELFKTLLTAAIITGALNMVLAFHFSANKDDEEKTRNTGKMADAITAAANANRAGSRKDQSAIHSGDDVTIRAADDPAAEQQENDA